MPSLASWGRREYLSIIEHLMFASTDASIFAPDAFHTKHIERHRSTWLVGGTSDAGASCWVVLVGCSVARRGKAREAKMRQSGVLSPSRCR